ncbi:MAG TPA: hypothetical protein VFH27_04970 [Longimicrobiaceae bacterium]|nr:hypothetical protein [Longimicrobiaceae bacterium]
MASKHWKVQVKGDPTADEIHRAVGANGGLVTRVHREKGETHVYFTGEEGLKEGHGLHGAGAASEVKAGDVTRF